MNSSSLPTSLLPRRNFLKQGAALLGAGGLATVSPRTALGAVAGAKAGGLVSPGDVILFQGDSITDTGWSREKGGTPNNQAALQLKVAAEKEKEKAAE